VEYNNVLVEHRRLSMEDKAKLQAMLDEGGRLGSKKQSIHDARKEWNNITKFVSVLNKQANYDASLIPWLTPEVAEQYPEAVPTANPTSQRRHATLAAAGKKKKGSEAVRTNGNRVWLDTVGGNFSSGCFEWRCFYQVQQQNLMFAAGDTILVSQEKEPCDMCKVLYCKFAKLYVINVVVHYHSLTNHISPAPGCLLFTPIGVQWCPVPL